MGTVRLAGLALIACGCNGLYGLDPTHVPDAPAPDAPARCPEAPGGQIAFSLVVAQQILQDCIDLSISPPTGAIAAMCIGEDELGTKHVAEGTLDTGLARANLTLHGTGEIRMVRLLPEGDELWVEQDPGAAGTVQRYRRDNAGAWAWFADVAFPELAIASTLGTVTRGPNRRVMIAAPGVKVVEYVDDGTAFTPIDYTLAELGLHSPVVVNLTTDARRGVVVEGASSNGGQEIRYLDRVAPEARFGPSSLVAGTSPEVYDPLLTDDCGRLYFNGLQSIMYSEIQ